MLAMASGSSLFLPRGAHLLDQMDSGHVSGK